MRMHYYKQQCIRDEPAFVPAAGAAVSSVLFAKVYHTRLCESKIVCHREVHFPFGLPIIRTVPDMIAYSETICVTARVETVVKLPANPHRK